MGAIVPMRLRGPAGWGRIHRRFCSISTGGSEPVLHRAGVKKCPRGIGRVKFAMAVFGTDLILPRGLCSAPVFQQSVGLVS
jgi:hypothetical protein